MTSAALPIARLEDQHQYLDDHLLGVLDALIALDFARAERGLRAFERLLDRHFAIEERWLFPVLAAQSGLRWGVNVYLAEHAKMRRIAAELCAPFAEAVAAPPPDAPHARRLALRLLDACHPLRHVLDHHQQREHAGLVAELPSDPRRDACCARAFRWAVARFA